jgi:hypothetical protein
MHRYRSRDGDPQRLATTKGLKVNIEERLELWKRKYKGFMVVYDNFNKLTGAKHLKIIGARNE